MTCVAELDGTSGPDLELDNIMLQAQFDLPFDLTGLGSSRIGLGLVWGLTWALGSTTI